MAIENPEKHLILGFLFFNIAFWLQIASKKKARPNVTQIGFLKPHEKSQTEARRQRGKAICEEIFRTNFLTISHKSLFIPVLWCSIFLGSNLCCSQRAKDPQEHLAKSRFGYKLILLAT